MIQTECTIGAGKYRKYDDTGLAETYEVQVTEYSSAMPGLVLLGPMCCYLFISEIPEETTVRSRPLPNVYLWMVKHHLFHFHACNTA
jgi:hypothetical protein